MTESPRRRPTGRRPGDSGTRDAILDAALTLFAERGYEGASVRAIAAAAGVDSALIRHFFTDKPTLFTTVVADRTAIPGRIGAAIGSAAAGAGWAAADAYLRLWESDETRPVLLSLVRSAATSPAAAQMLRETLFSRVLAQSGVPSENVVRLALAGTHLLGIAVARHVVLLPPLVDLTLEELVAQVGPTIHRYLTGTHLDPPALSSSQPG